MSRIIIIGAGLAGLSAGTNLLKKENELTIIEQSSFAGGRVKSIFYPEIGKEIDYGQHLILGCYQNTLNYIKDIGAKKFYKTIKGLDFTFFDQKHQKFDLKTKNSIYPLNFYKAFRDFNFLNQIEKDGAIRLFLNIFLNKIKSKKNARQLLVEYNQSKNSIENFWQLILVSIFNCDLDRISGELFCSVMKKIFLKGNTGSYKIIPNVTLNKLLIEPAINKITRKGGKLNLNEAVKEFVIENNRIISIKTNKNNYTNFDYVISAVDIDSLVKLIPANIILPETTPSYSNIINIYIRLKKNPFDIYMTGFFDSTIHWVFSSDNEINILASNPVNDYMLGKDELLNKLINRLEVLYPKFNKDFIEIAIIQKINKSTIVIEKQIQEIIKKIDINVKNLIICGDWTLKNLPSTIEAAILSGKNIKLNNRKL